MKSKYSGIEIETKLDEVSNKLNKYDVIDICPRTLTPEFNKYNIFNSNVIIKLLEQLKNFKIQSPNSFIEFVDNIPGYHLLTDEQLEKLQSMSSSFVGVFSTIRDIPNVYTNGSLALVQFNPFNQPSFVFRSNKKWFFLDGNKIQFNAIVSDKLVVGHTVIRPYKMAKLILYAHNTNNTQTIEFNVIKGSNSWWLQVFKSTLLESENELIDIHINRSEFLFDYPEIIVDALDSCTISMDLKVIL